MTYSPPRWLIAVFIKAFVLVVKETVSLLGDLVVKRLACLYLLYCYRHCSDYGLSYFMSIYSDGVFITCCGKESWFGYHVCFIVTVTVLRVWFDLTRTHEHTTSSVQCITYSVCQHTTWSFKSIIIIFTYFSAFI